MFATWPAKADTSRSSSSRGSQVGPRSANVLVVNEHLGDVDERVEQLERRVQRRARGDHLDQLFPIGGGGHLCLDPVGVAGQLRHQNPGRGIEPAFPHHKMRGQM